MPAVSKAQLKFMQMCKHDPKHAYGKCPDKETAAEFAHTSRKDLPEHKGRKKRPPHRGN